MTSTYALWGWGAPGDEPDAGALAAAVPLVTDRLGFKAQEPECPSALPDLDGPRLRPPPGLASICSVDPLDRARHGIGRSYLDVLRGLRGWDLRPADLVVRPADEEAVAATLEWAAREGAVVVPYGGGTSVVGGVGPVRSQAPVLSVDLELLAGVVEVDRVSRAARVRAGTTGPALEAGLRERGLTARFFPQSFERSTLGGWVATRAAGHYSARLQHVDDLVESIRAVTPRGLWESRRLPGSGAGPSPDRLLLGSEGTLGVITEAWLRVQDRPLHRRSAVLAARSFEQGSAAVRHLVQSGLAPATCRLVDAGEARVTETLDTGESALVLGAESSVPGDDGARSAETGLAAAVDACLAGGLRPLPDAAGGEAGATWRSSFLRAPLLREMLVLLGVLVDTFETAVTWDRLDAFVTEVRGATTEALNSACGAGFVTCRLTHAYPDGAAPYFTMLAPARRGSEPSQWEAVKAAASDAVLRGGGTVTHHHAVGRDHRPWYDRQRPEPFADALAAAKSALDPLWTMNPGVLLAPPPG